MTEKLNLKVSEGFTLTDFVRLCCVRKAEYVNE